MRIFLKNTVAIFKTYGVPILWFSSVVFFVFQQIFFLEKGKYIISYFLDDPYLNMAILKHNFETLTSGNLTNFWHLNIFYPYKYTMAFSENLIPQSIFLWPIYELSGHNIIVTYNWGILLSIIALSFTSYVMLYYQIKNVRSSILGATFFAFSPFFLTHLNHFQVISAIWMPLMFLSLHLSFKKKVLRLIILASIFYILQLASCMYYMVILPIFVVIYFLTQYYYDRKNFKFYIKALLIFILFSAIPITIISLPYMKVRMLYGLRRTLSSVIVSSPTFLSLVLPTPCSLLDTIMKSVIKDIPYYNTTRLYIGVLPFMFLLFALVSIEKNVLVTFSFKKYNNNKQKEYIPLFTVKNHQYPPLIKALWWSFWTSLTLSLGPLIFRRLPNPVYILFYKAYPGASGIRAPQRFYAVTILSIAVFIAYFHNIYFKNKKRDTLLIISLLLILVDYLPKNAPIRKMPYNGNVPNVYIWIAKHTKNKDRLMEFPLYEEFYDDSIHCINPDSIRNRNGLFYTFYSAFHKRDIFNGYSGYPSPLYIYALFSPPKTQLEIARSTGIKYLIIHNDIYDDIEQLANLQTDPHVKQNLKYLNHRQELIREIKHMNALRVYKDSIAEVYELKDVNTNFVPDKAYLSFCKIAISTEFKADTLSLKFFNKGSSPCILLHKEQIRIEINENKSKIIRKKIELNPGSFPPFMQHNDSFQLHIPIRIPNIPKGTTIKLFTYSKSHDKKWKKLGECTLKIQKN